MTAEQRRKNLCPPRPGAHVVLDTDTYNEIDDQFALSWQMLSPELNTKALYAAPFFNENSTGPEDGMRRSYEEIHKLLGLLGRDAPVFPGSPRYLPDEKSPVPSPAAEDLARRAEGYSPENPLYVAAIGAITNVASAILLNPRVAENTVVVWLGGNGRHWPDGREFNLSQDIAAARVVMASGVPFVQLPCGGVVDRLSTTRPELEHWLKGKNPLASYLAENTIQAAESYGKGTAWSRVIWDVSTVAWLLDREARMVSTQIVPMCLPGYGHQYEDGPEGLEMGYVYRVDRDRVFTRMFQCLGEHSAWRRARGSFRRLGCRLGRLGTVAAH